MLTSRRACVSSRGASGRALLRAAAVSLALGAAWALPASAQPSHAAAQPARSAQSTHADSKPVPHAPAGSLADSHAASEHGQAEHAGEHHQDFNWYYGLIGVKEGVSPSLLWRNPGMPTPFAGLLFNTLLLFALLYKVARKPVAKALADRRQRIMRGIDEATAMKEEAKSQLEMYRHKLDNLDTEIERVRREMRETAEVERRRILDDAANRRLRLEQEARLLIDQELKAVRDDLMRETARAALRSARELLQTNTSTDDHRRLCEEYLETLRPPSPSDGATGGRSEST